MISDLRWPILVLGNCILIFLMQLINSALAPTTIHLSLFALFIFAPLILLRFTPGLTCVILTGLIFDSSASLPLGTSTIILSIIYTAAFSFRHQFKAYSSSHNMMILQSTNAIAFAFLSVSINPSNHAHLYYWISILINLLFSQILLLFITPWFLNLQNSLLSLLNSSLKTSDIQKQIDDPTAENL